MKKLVFVAVLIAIQPGLTFGSGLTSNEWNKSNIEALRAYGKDSVQSLVNSLNGGGPHATVGGFAGTI